MKTCLIRQPAGLGDIFYCLKIADDLISKDYDVVWPVLPEFIYLKDRLVYDPRLTICSMNDNFIRRELFMHRSKELIYATDFMYLPLQDASHVISAPTIMDSKYFMAGITSENWQEHFNFKRDMDKEQHLFRDILKLDENSKYVFVNRNYASPPNMLRYLKEMKYSKDIRIVEMSFVDGMLPFDWSLVLENAAEIHTVGTSLTFIIEKLNVTDKLFVYRRQNQDESDFMRERIFAKNWEKVS